MVRVGVQREVTLRIGDTLKCYSTSKTESKSGEQNGERKTEMEKSKKHKEKAVVTYLK